MGESKGDDTKKTLYQNFTHEIQKIVNTYKKGSQ